jgi:PIN domain nuclease of toxin-antitoxin system
MKYLLDTHIFIWAMVSPDKLSKQVQKLLLNTDNTIFVSAISLWEISIKFSLGNLQLNNLMPSELIFLCEEMGFKLINLHAKETATFYNLKVQYHKDPFDRMLIWQALKNNFVMISDDKNVKKYVSEGLQVIG